MVVVAVRADATHDLHPLGPIALVHGPELVSAAAHPIRADGLQLHADIETLLETTIRTSFPLRLVDVTSAIGHTRVDLLVLNRPLEEALAAFAGQQAIVVAAHLVPANRTKLLNSDVLCVHHRDRVKASQHCANMCWRRCWRIVVKTMGD
jgi:hypothetical protein